MVGHPFLQQRKKKWWSSKKSNQETNITLDVQKCIPNSFQCKNKNNFKIKALVCIICSTSDSLNWDIKLPWYIPLSERKPSLLHICNEIDSQKKKKEVSHLTFSTKTSKMRSWNFAGLEKHDKRLENRELFGNTPNTRWASWNATSTGFS